MKTQVKVYTDKPFLYTLLGLFFSLMVMSISCQRTQTSPKTDASVIADSLQEFSIQKLYDGKFAEAINYNKRAMEFYIQANDSLGISDCMANISICHTRLGDMSSAIEYATQALNMDLSLGDQERISSSYNTLAGIYLSAKDPHKAIPFIRKAIHLEESLIPSKNLSTRYGMASEIYLMLGQKDSSLYYAKKALNIDYQQKDTVKFARRLAQLGDGLSASGKYKEAEASYLESLQWLTIKPSPMSRCIVHKQLGNLMRNTGRQQMAIHFLEQAAKEAEALGNIYIQQSCCEALSELLETNQPIQALQWLRNSNALKDSLYNLQLAKLTSNYAAQYDLAEKRHTIHVQEDELKVQKLGFITAIITSFFLLAFCILLMIYIRQKKRYHAAIMQELMNRLNTITSTTAKEEKPLHIEETLKERDQNLLDQFNEYVLTHLNESSLNSEIIAESLCISQRHLNRRVKELTGQDTSSFIRTMRIESAIKLLANPSLNITDVYIQCGFESPSYFSKVFKEYTGLTPTTYRKKLLSKDK